ncbi:sensor histidine kinase [Streptomyces hainanensis]|uniref:histidine kinase n=1 Tax=Streptomyces hainanensis TaxID=402648 RepID=A0A4R4SYY7_9ACTN|nr:histidine kinase [Streptomyces hainanensis]TDC68506.1 sensor histidine kinase [Streptomyces hainanensis]
MTPRSAAPRDTPGGAARGARPPWPSSAAVLVIQLVGSGVAAHGQPDRAALDAVGLFLLGLGPLLLFARRALPRLAVLGAAAVTLAYLALGYPYGPVFLSVAVATGHAVIAGHRRVAVGAMALLWVGLVLTAEGPVNWGAAAAMAAWMVAVLAVSEVVRTRREQRAAERAERAAAERRRADEERLRIARELHDVLAHSISVINVQAGMGLALLDSDPEQARTALTTIRSASREALGEVRQVLDTLRAPGAAPRTPAPGLDRLPDLAEQAAHAGLRVETSTEGPPVPLPPGADLAAFRIVQEALTNIVRHSGSRAARVRLRYAPELLELRVEDDGPATGSGGAGGGGRGLLGMRERAAALGGTVTAGPVPGGGFRVVARLPHVVPDRPAAAETETATATEIRETT